MSMSPEVWRFMQQLNNYLQAQHEQLQRMEARIQELLTEFNRFKEQSAAPQPIRNEYRFDLLKVERLEGTLNIGINPNAKDSDSSIEEFAIGQTLDVPSPIEKQHPQLFPGIKQQVDDYLSSGAYQTLGSLESQSGYPLEAQYRQFIVEDVRKQIDRRIRDYLKRIHPEEAGPEQAEDIQQSVYEKVKRDIEKTFETYLQNLSRKESGA